MQRRFVFGSADGKVSESEKLPILGLWLCNAQLAKESLPESELGIAASAMLSQPAHSTSGASHVMRKSAALAWAWQSPKMRSRSPSSSRCRVCDPVLDVANALVAFPVFRSRVSASSSDVLDALLHWSIGSGHTRVKTVRP